VIDPNRLLIEYMAELRAAAPDADSVTIFPSKFVAWCKERKGVEARAELDPQHKGRINVSVSCELARPVAFSIRETAK
jgi:hypothetical protein